MSEEFFFFFFWSSREAWSFAGDVVVPIWHPEEMHLRTSRWLSVGLALGIHPDHLFRPGGLLDAIPTKTPILPHQFCTLCRLSFRNSFQVCRTMYGSIVFFLNTLGLVCTLSIRSRVFIAWSHLLWISWPEWNLAGLLLQAMARSQRSVQIMYIDCLKSITQVIRTPACALKTCASVLPWLLKTLHLVWRVGDRCILCWVPCIHHFFPLHSSLEQTMTATARSVRLRTDNHLCDRVIPPHVSIHIL